MVALHRSPSPRPEGGSSRRRGGFVFLRPLVSRATHLRTSVFRVRLRPAEPPPREPPTLFLRRPVYPSALPSPLPLRSRSTPPCVLSRATPLLILLQTGSIPPAPVSRDVALADPREVRWSDTRRCVYTLIYKLYCLYIFLVILVVVVNLNDFEFRTHVMITPVALLRFERSQ